MFDVKFKLTLNNYREFFKYSLKKQLKVPIILSCVWLILGIIVIVLNFTTTFKALTSGIFLLCLAFLQVPFIILFSYIGYKLNIKKDSAYLGQLTNEIKFNENNLVEKVFLEKDLMGKQTLLYASVLRLGESENLIYIYYDKVNCVIIPKESFNEDLQEFKKFILNKIIK